ncbi:MAG TPA: tetratricopeptide repeat protein [Myxococcota bacterium]|nr:tetratricopeptide repeat protein [Myxococcota bacterium]
MFAGRGALLGAKLSKTMRALGRLVFMGVFLIVAGSMVQGNGVLASEGDSVDKLSGPSEAGADSTIRRIVVSGAGGFQVLLSEGSKAGSVTVVSGMNCAKLTAACRYIKTGRLDDAVGSIRAQIAAGEDSALLRVGLANVLFMQGDHLGAARAYTWAAAAFPKNPDVINGFGNIFVELQQPLDAIREFRALAKEPGYLAVAHNNLGRALVAAGKPQQALIEYAQASQAEPGLFAAAYNGAGILLARNEYHEAASLFRQAAHSAPAVGRAYLFEGLAHLGDQNPILAAVALFRASELGVCDRALNLALGMACQQLGLNEEAALRLGRAIEQDPSEPRAYQVLSISLVRLGRLADAADILERGFARGTQDSEAQFMQGLKLFLCEQPQLAARHFMRAIAMGRRKPDSFFALGQALLQAGQTKPAIRSLTLAIGLSPESAAAHFALGVALVHDGNLPGAVLEMKKSASLDPADEDTQLVLMDLLYRTNDFTGCTAVGKKIVDRNTELISPRFDIALCLAQSGDFEHAAESMNDALDHDIDGEELPQAWKKLGRLTDLDSAAPGPHLLLALINSRRGNWNDAVRNLERFILLSPSKHWTRKAVQMIHELLPRRQAPCRACRAGP